MNVGTYDFSNAWQQAWQQGRKVERSCIETHTAARGHASHYGSSSRPGLAVATLFVISSEESIKN